MSNLFMASFLENILGDTRKHNEYKGQISFDCPLCDHGRHKGNLEVNYTLGVYKCWSCKEINNMYGRLDRLVSQFGNKSDIETFKLIKPDYDNNLFESIRTTFLELPKELHQLTDDESKEAKDVKKYLYARKITDEMILKFGMMYSKEKGYRCRVVIPSKNREGDIEYYISRAIYDIMSPKYRNPDYNKDNIIFFESLINWEANIYLVEGVFDALVIPNSIPLLGKYANHNLISKLLEKAKSQIIIIFDGEEEAKEDMIKLYKTLNILNLTNRIKVIELVNGYDLSQINEEHGKQGIINVLKTAKRL